MPEVYETRGDDLLPLLVDLPIHDAPHLLRSVGEQDDLEVRCQQPDLHEIVRQAVRDRLPIGPWHPSIPEGQKGLAIFVMKSDRPAVGHPIDARYGVLGHILSAVVPLVEAVAPPSERKLGPPKY
jgi:hypothetical protein